MTVPVLLAAWFAGCSVEPDIAPLPEVSPDAPADWQSRAQAAIAVGEYAAHLDGESFRATNRAQDFRAVIDEHGLAIHPRTGAGEVRLSLVAWGREGAIEAVDPAIPEEGPCLVGMTDAFGECLHRVQAERPGLVEWWENRPEGLEHGFVVEPADGEGALVFELAVAGAQVEIDGDAAILRREGEPLRYAGLVAWDETGRTLPAWLEEGDGIRIVVDDEGAIGAITVDPLLTTVAWSAEANQGSAGLGVSVASAGDVNGDGFGDVLVGAYIYDNGQTNEGRAWLYLGSASGLGTSAAWTAESDQAQAYFGFTVASAGDVDADGYGDVVVSAPLYENGSTDEGRVYVYHGSTSGLSTSASATLESNQVSAYFGWAGLGSAGDVNGDGFADIVVGAYGYDNGQTNEGRAYAYLGSASGISTTASWTAESNQAGAAFGYAAGAAGDVNGDGYDDVIVGASTYDNGQADEGGAWVYLGSSSGIGAAASWTTESNQAGANVFIVGSAGDVNGDGYADVVVGEWYYDNGSTDEGRASVFLGSAAGPEATASWTAEPNQASAHMGIAAATAGDVNGDGFGDLIVGSYAYDNGSLDEGRATVYLGSPTGLGTAAAWSVEGNQASAYLGRSAASAGDVNGDGFGDVIVGADTYDNGSADEGAAFVYLGSPSGLSDTPPSTIDGDQASAELGFAVSGAGDLNGDGFGDVVIGAPLYDNGSTDEGAAFVYLGSTDGLASTAAWSGEGNQAGAYFGWSAGSGDFDGDGFADLVIGAPQYDNGETDEGRAYVYLGSTSGLDTTATWTGESDQASAEYGHAVAGAGDVNADGYDEVLVSARYYDNGSTNEGQAYLYNGSSSGPATTADWRNEANQTSAIFGFSVASAHDVNGDGYGDVIVGAVGWNNGSTDEGRAYVYEGSATGLSTTAAWTVEPNVAQSFFGYAVASAGDVNGDGYADVIVGAAYWDNGSTDEGGAWVYEGSATGLSTTAAWTAESDQSAANFGWSVASADVNGDGYGDVIVGAPLYDNGSSDEGRVSVYDGSATGLSTTADWTDESDVASAAFGWSVANAGDIDADGYGDVLVGAYLADNGSTDEGQVYLYKGNGEDGTGPGLTYATQAQRTGTDTPVSPGLSAGDDSFDVGMATARGHWGSARIQLQIEAKALGTAFDGSDLVESAYTASGTAGVVIEETLEGLAGETAYHWRARVAVDPTQGFPQGWGPWIYGGISGDPSGTHARTTVGTVYADADGDGYGDPAAGVVGSVSAGYVQDATDCDDTNAEINPASDELCDDADVDEDCDGLSDDADDGVIEQPTWYDDDDGDGYGNAAHGGTDSCEEVPGTVSDDTDCDDGDATINPGADEICDGFGNDDDCDGLLDEDDPDLADGTTWYVDSDRDGYGSDTTTEVNCDATAPSGFVADGTDCDDANAAISPGDAEVCDASNADEDCDGLADDLDTSVTGTTTWYADTDGDGYGSATSTTACDAPSGYVANTTDCDDTNAGISPADAEICDSSDTDEDCDGLSDDADTSVTGQTTYYVDADSDGQGGTTTQSSCEGTPSGYVATSTDCNDSSTSVYLGATEIVADGLDQDCDAVDSCYTDADGDNYGTTVVTDGSSLSCATGTGAAVSTDCDDTSSSIHPGASEVCDSADADEDCDGTVEDADSSVSGQATYYADVDGDGYGSDTAVLSCDRPSGYVSDTTDCDDTSAAISPADTEICDSANTDEDCDGLADDADTSVSGATTYYADVDRDGYGGDTTRLSCEGVPSGYVADTTDCDDSAATVSPAGTEVVADGIDQDCDTVDSCYTDADADTYGTTVVIDGSSLSCATGTGAANASDCDDSSATIHPGATEVVGDGIDQTCDGAESCYVDADGDGARTLYTVASPDASCTGSGEALGTADLDCDDGDADAYPGATEIVGDGVDEDCDGAEDCYVDADEDSYRPDATSTVASGDADCSDVGEALASALTGDCDDADAAFHPFASEGDCSDANDYNCDGSTGYIDADGDGSAACEECDDADAAIFPGATEVPGDGVDGDCSGADTCYVDADDDGYRPDATATVAGTTVACDGAGEAASSEPTDDCDDADPTSNPGAIETVGDGVDNDCDGDETCFVDADDDGYRSEDGATVASTDGDCADVGEALALAAYDCDDGDDTISPTATELVGDGVDGDCDGTEDCYADADGDGVRPDATSLVPSADATCDGPGEATTTDPTGDCDDTDATAYPGAPEVVGDGVDEDCDGAEDCYTDLDDDGYTDGDTRVSADTDCADASEATADDPDGDCDDTDDRFHPDATESDCTDPSDYNCDGSTGYDDVDGDRYAACEDCDDTDATVRPGAVEAVGDGVDQDCDQLEDCYVDADDDGYRPDATSTVSTATVTCTGSGEAFVTDPIDDCDDADATVNPGATEVVADGIDEDCDGDELCWLDADNDGYTADEPSTIVSPDLACDSTGEADGDAPAGDCDDTDDDTNPGAAETDCLDPADYNCDGSSGSIDGDADGFAACEECDDGVAAINPDADEVCNDLDDDCDGTTDVDAVDATTWYVDSDGDGYTDPDASVVECDAPEGYMAATEADCDDDDAAVNPGGDDVPGDTIDQDCDGVDAVAEGEGDDTGGAPKEDGCGCATADPVGLSALMLAALVLVRRRRGQPGLRGVGVTRASVPGTCGSRGRR